MAVDEAVAVILERALAGDPTIRAQKMFGGIGFMRRGHMLCGAMSEKMGGGAMFRVGEAPSTGRCPVYHWTQRAAMWTCCRPRAASSRR